MRVTGKELRRDYPEAAALARPLGCCQAFGEQRIAELLHEALRKGHFVAQLVAQLAGQSLHVNEARIDQFSFEARSGSFGRLVLLCIYYYFIFNFFKNSRFSSNI